MGYKELIESLQQEGEEKIRLQRSEARAAAEKIRNETSLKIQEMRKEYGLKQQAAQRSQEEILMTDAKKQARLIRLEAEKKLSDRIFSLALSCLSELRNDDYVHIFESLVKELPHAQWRNVRVCAEDLKYAAHYFPGADCDADREITGGFLVCSDDNRIHIDNTFEKRLERIWDDILPLIIKDAVSEAKHHGTSATP